MHRREAATHAPWTANAPASASAPSKPSKPSASASAPAPPVPAVRLALPSEDELSNDSWRGAAREVRRAAIPRLYPPYISPISPLYLAKVRRACAAAMAPLAEAAWASARHGMGADARARAAATFPAHERD